MTEATGVEEESLGTDEEFEDLLAFIRDSRGFDFTGYKRPSLKRRIAHRMQAVHVPTYKQYKAHLEEHDGEFIELFNTILINVTSFFRDPPAWQVLAETTLPRIVEAKGPEDPIRIWSAGCATGEEAYTLAMLFAEALGEQAYRDRVKIYATDIDEEALVDARHARYPESALEEVPDELKTKYFHESNGRYSFKPDFRRAVIFGRNDLLADPPISRVDLIAARNTLMYFNPDAQSRILANFHFALTPEGALFLGRSEVLLTRSALFEPTDLKRRVFSKIPNTDFRRGAEAPHHRPGLQ